MGSGERVLGVRTNFELTVTNGLAKPENAMGIRKGVPRRGNGMERRKGGSALSGMGYLGP